MKNICYFVLVVFLMLTGCGVEPDSSRTSGVNSALTSDSLAAVSDGNAIVSWDSETNYYGDWDFITSLYQRLLTREPDTGGLQYWMGIYKNSGHNRENVARQIAASSEFSSVFVSGQYQALLDRGADGSGLQYWTGRMQQGLSQEGLMAELCNSDEFWQKSGANNAGFVERLYNKILQRNSDGGGKQYWVAQLNGGRSRISVASAFISSGECLTLFVRQAYNRLLGRDADSGGLNYWAGRMAGGLSQKELTILFAGSAEFGDNAIRYGLSIHPQVQYTSVPPIGSANPICGKVANADPSTYKIAVYIFVPGWGWVTKPYENKPYTSIGSDGTWSCYYVTGGNDQKATIIAAFLVPVAYNPPVILGKSSLGTELFNNAKAYNMVNR